MRLPIPTGIGPSREFPVRSREESEVSVDIAGGIDPVILIEYKRRIDNLVKLPIQVGKGPLISSPPASKKVRAVRVDIELGNW